MPPLLSVIFIEKDPVYEVGDGLLDNDADYDYSAVEGEEGVSGDI